MNPVETGSSNLGSVADARVHWVAAIAATQAAARAAKNAVAAATALPARPTPAYFTAALRVNAAVNRAHYDAANAVAQSDAVAFARVSSIDYAALLTADDNVSKFWPSFI